MKRRHFLCSFLMPLLLSGQQPTVVGLAEAPLPKPPKPQFFSGLVIEADTDHVKVSRNLLGRQPETHVFAVDHKTKTPKGGVKVKTSVTVRYQHLPERDLALEIQLKPSNHGPKPS